MTPYKQDRPGGLSGKKSTNRLQKLFEASARRWGSQSWKWTELTGFRAQSFGFRAYIQLK